MQMNQRNFRICRKLILIGLFATMVWSLVNKNPVKLAVTDDYGSDDYFGEMLFDDDQMEY